MSTSQKKPFSYEIEQGLPIPLEKRAYYHARVRNRIYNFVLNKFLEKEKSQKLTKAELARRIESDAATVNRLLAAPGNWTLKTVSDLLLGIAGEELEPQSVSVVRVPRNFREEDLQRLLRERKPLTDQPKPGSTLFEKQDDPFEALRGKKINQ